MTFDIPSVADARAIKAHLSNLVASANDLPDIVTAIRYMMEGYCKTGVDRPLACRTEPIRLDGFTAEWIIPARADPRRRIVYLHGGGWFAGSTGTHRHLLDLLASATGRSVMSVDYRMAPEYPFPASLDDARTAFGWARLNGPDGPGTVTHLALLGDSAGGNLSAALVVDLLRRGKPVPDALGLLSPVLDFRRPKQAAQGLDDVTCTADSLIEISRSYLQDATTVDDPLVSPSAADAAVLARFPATLIQTGSQEYLRDQDVAFAASLWNQGVIVQLSVWAGQPHAFHLFPQELSAARRAIDEIAAFLAVPA